MRRKLIDIAPSPEDSAPLEDHALLLEIVRALVDQPEKVRIETRDYPDGSSMLIIHCEKADRGQVVGRRGQVISAIKQVFGSIGAMDDRNVSIRVHG